MAVVEELNLVKLLEHAHIGVVIHRWDTSIVYANPAALRLLRLSYDKVIGKDADDPQWRFIDESGRKLFNEDFPVNKVKRFKGRLTNELLGIIDESEAISWFLVNAYTEGNVEAEDCFIVITFTDITDSKHLFSYQEIVENTQDVVIVTEADNTDYPMGPKIVYVNKAFEALTGYTAEEVIGETPRILQGTLTDPDTKSRIRKAIKRHEPITETLLNYSSKGHPYWVEMSILPLQNRYGEVTHFAAIERDISERIFHIDQLKSRNADLKALKKNLEDIVEERTRELQKAKSALQNAAYIDPLTDIPNRRYFLEQAHKLARFCSRRQLGMTVGIMDVDDFKKINDNYGHDAGDSALVKLAEYLKTFFRIDDLFGRIGGEEFAFALAIENEAGLRNMATRLLEGISSLALEPEPGVKFDITVSMGIKCCAKESAIDIRQAMKDADKAMYQSKQDGKNGFTLIIDTQ